MKAHIFVAALALLVQRLLDRRLEEAGINFSAERAMEALQTVRLVTFRMDDRPERRGVSGGCPDAHTGPEGIEVDGFEAAYTPRGGGNRDVVTIRKIESCPPRGYVDGPQTWASGRGRAATTATVTTVTIVYIHFSGRQAGGKLAEQDLRVGPDRVEIQVGDARLHVDRAARDQVEIGARFKSR